MENEIYLTKDGFKALQEKLDYLKSTKREEIAKKIGVAREFGDLSENSEYDAAKEEQAQIEAEISDIENKLRFGKIINQKKKQNTDDDEKTNDLELSFCCAQPAGTDRPAVYCEPIGRRPG